MIGKLITAIILSIEQLDSFSTNRKCKGLKPYTAQEWLNGHLYMDTESMQSINSGASSRTTCRKTCTNTIKYVLK